MKNFVIFLFLVIASVGFSQTKTIKIKKEKGVRFTYSLDSTCFEHKENVKIMNVFFQFYNSIYEGDSLTYLNLLSPGTKQTIEPIKLMRKFIRYKSYVPQLFGTMELTWIKPIPEKISELETPFMVMIKLPAGETADHRVGFDPAKRYKKEDESYIGLMLTKIEDEIKVVIPW